MKKIFLLLISVFLLTGCGKVDKEKLVKEFVNRVESSKSYIANSNMEIYNGEDTFVYDIKVMYMDDDYYRVDMLNTLSNHKQVILRNEEEVYVVTPSLNKSYKFVSDWPYNSSQSYLLNSLVNDIKNEDNVIFTKEEKGYSLKVGVEYPNNPNLSYEMLYFDNDLNLNTVAVYDTEGIVAIKVVFNKIDYKANLSPNDFDVNNFVKENIDSSDNENETEETASLEDVIYPLYIPADTYLKDKETVSTENGERVILTFLGDSPFTIIEETVTVDKQIETINMSGEPMMLIDTIGSVSDNSITWISNGIEYYATSETLNDTELLEVVKSISVMPVGK